MCVGEHSKALVFLKQEKYTTGEQITWFLFPNFIISQHNYRTIKTSPQTFPLPQAVPQCG